LTFIRTLLTDSRTNNTNITVVISLHASRAGEAEYCFYQRPCVCLSIHAITEQSSHGLWDSAGL